MCVRQACGFERSVLGELGWYFVLVVAGFVAGIVNTIAGGGSFLTLPALMLFGLDPKLANGTNRIAVALSSVSATVTFSRQGLLDRENTRRLLLPTLAGVPLGAMLAIYLPGKAFEGAFGLLFLCMACLLIANPSQIVRRHTSSEETPNRWASVVFLFIGIYVGFIQAGLGVLLLLAMHLLGIHCGDLVRSNAIKNLVGGIVTLSAAAIYAMSGLVDYRVGLTMAAGNVVGGVIGAKLVIKKGNRFVFTFLIVVMVATGAKLLWTSVSG